MESPNAIGLVTAPTLQLLKRTTIKTLIDEIIPPPLIEYHNQTNGEIKLTNGYTIYTIPSDDNEKIRSINAAHVHMEESSNIKRSIFDQLLSRLRNPYGKNKAIFVCSNPEIGWLKDVLVDNERRRNPNDPEHADYNPYMTVFIWPTWLNKNLPPDFIEMNSRAKPKWWVRKYIEGSFEHAEGQVYPNFANTIIEPFEIPKHWQICIGLDHGMRNPTAVGFFAIDPEHGMVYMFDEYYVPGRTVPEHAAALKPKISQFGHGRILFMVADPSVRNRTDPVNGKSVLGLYTEYDLHFQPANNDVAAGLLRVNSYIDRNKLKIFKTCVNTIKEGLNYKFPEVTMDSDKNLDEKPIKANDHAMDMVKYVCLRLPENPDDLTNLSYSPPKRYARIVGDANEYGWDDSGKYEDNMEDWRSYT